MRINKRTLIVSALILQIIYLGICYVYIGSFEQKGWDVSVADCMLISVQMSFFETVFTIIIAYIIFNISALFKNENVLFAYGSTRKLYNICSKKFLGVAVLWTCYQTLFVGLWSSICDREFINWNSADSLFFYYTGTVIHISFYEFIIRYVVGMITCLYIIETFMFALEWRYNRMISIIVIILLYICEKYTAKNYFFKKMILQYSSDYKEKLPVRIIVCVGILIGCYFIGLMIMRKKEFFDKRREKCSK